MAFDDGLLKALNMFSNGVRSFRTGEAIKKANDRVRKVRESQMEESDRRQQIRVEAQRAATEVLSISLDPKLAKSVQDTLQPAGILGAKPPKTLNEAALRDDPKFQKRARRLEEEALDRKMRLKKFNSSSTAKGRFLDPKATHENKEVRAYLSDHKSERQSLRSVTLAKERISLGGVADVNFGIKLMLTMVEKRLTDQDWVKGQSRTNLALHQRLADSAKGFFTGGASEALKQDVLKAMSALESGTIRGLESDAEGAGSLQEAISGGRIKQKDFKDLIEKGLGVEFSSKKGTAGVSPKSKGRLKMINGKLKRVR